MPRAKRRRALRIPPHEKARGGGAPKGAPQLPFRLTATAGRAFKAGASPSDAPPAAFLSPGPCFRVRDGGLFALFIRAAFAALRPHLVQPFKADPHSRAGRLPGASRCRGYKPRQQAPPPPHVRQCPAERPSHGVDSPIDRNKWDGSQGLFSGPQLAPAGALRSCCERSIRHPEVRAPASLEG